MATTQVMYVADASCVSSKLLKDEDDRGGCMLHVAFVSCCESVRSKTESEMSHRDNQMTHHTHLCHLQLLALHYRVDAFHTQYPFHSASWVLGAAGMNSWFTLGSLLVRCTILACGVSRYYLIPAKYIQILRSALHSIIFGTRGRNAAIKDPSADILVTTPQSLFIGC